MEISMVLESYLIYDDEYYDFAYEGEGGGIWNAIKGFFQKIWQKIVELKDRLVAFLKNNFGKDARVTRKSNKAVWKYLKTVIGTGTDIFNSPIKTKEVDPRIEKIKNKLDQCSDIHERIQTPTTEMEPKIAKELITALNNQQQKIKNAIAQIGTIKDQDSGKLKEWTSIFNSYLTHLSNCITIVNSSMNRYNDQDNK